MSYFVHDNDAGYDASASQGIKSIRYLYKQGTWLSLTGVALPRNTLQMIKYSNSWQKTVANC